jgi:PPOX class probable F420-dependent enzyme
LFPFIDIECIAIYTHRSLQYYLMLPLHFTDIVSPRYSECYNKNMTNRKTLTETEILFTNTQRVARLATADLDGHPHIVPVCYAFDGTHFYIPLDEKPKKVDESRLRRVRNIEARHEASLLIDQYDDDWSRLGYVLVHGHAALLQTEDSLHALALVLLRERYIQYRSMELEKHSVIIITPDSVTSWGPALGRN